MELEDDLIPANAIRLEVCYNTTVEYNLYEQHVIFES